MLRKQGDPLAFSHLQRSIHFEPNVSAVWKALGHALAQDGRPAAAAAALKSAILTSDGDDLAARTGLATVLAQQGQASAALDELIAVRRAAGPSSSAAVLMEDAFERLCRKLYPGHRCSAVQNEARAAAWAGALQVACPEGGRVLDMSSTPLVAMIVAARLPVCRPVVRVEALPLSVSLEVSLHVSFLPLDPPPSPSLRLASSVSLEVCCPLVLPLPFPLGLPCRPPLARLLCPLSSSCHFRQLGRPFGNSSHLNESLAWRSSHLESLARHLWPELAYGLRISSPLEHNHSLPIAVASLPLRPLLRRLIGGPCAWAGARRQQRGRRPALRRCVASGGMHSQFSGRHPEPAAKLASASERRAQGDLRRGPAQRGRPPPFAALRLGG